MLYPCILTYIRVSHSGGGGAWGGTPSPILRFFFENLPYQILRSSPHVWNTCGKLYIYVKLRYITASKVSFFIVLQQNFYHRDAEFFYLINWHYSLLKCCETVNRQSIINRCCLSCFFSIDIRSNQFSVDLYLSWLSLYFETLLQHIV